MTSIADESPLPSMSMGSSAPRVASAPSTPSPSRSTPRAHPFVAAPLRLIGTRHYYAFRSFHAPPSFFSDAGPNYYVDFGLKKFDAYQLLKRRSHSLALRGFIDRAAAELQLQLDRRLARDPSIEATRTRLMTVAFDTHSHAYRASGFAELRVGDQIDVLVTAGSDILAAGVVSGLGMFARSFDMALWPSRGVLGEGVRGSLFA